MNVKQLIASAAIAAIALTAATASASDPAPAAKKHASAKKAKTPPAPSVQEQIQALRQSLENQGAQINSLKDDLAAKDARLQQAEKAAADAQAAAADARAAAAHRKPGAESKCLRGERAVEHCNRSQGQPGFPGIHSIGRDQQDQESNGESHHPSLQGHHVWRPMDSSTANPSIAPTPPAAKRPPRGVPFPLNMQIPTL